MKNTTPEIQDYLDAVPAERQAAFLQLRQTILDNTSQLSEEISYGMIGYVVPKSIYPAGYHCNPKLPLPFISIASQKSSINFYHMGLYANPQLYSWFLQEYSKLSNSKPDVGKSCVRFKKWNEIPFELLAQLCQKMNTPQWIELYEKEIKK